MSGVKQAIVTYLGGAKLLKLKSFDDPLMFHKIVSEGFPAKCVLEFKTLSGFSNVEVSEVLGVSEKTFIRWCADPDKRIDAVVSDRLYRTAKALALAEEVLEDPALAREWLNEPQFGLGNKMPLELLTTDAGSREVEDLLLRMEHGYLA